MYLILAILLLTLSFVLWKRKNNGLPPGPWGLPIVGYLPWLNPEEPHITLTELSKRYGPVYGLHLGSVFTVVLTEPRMIRQVLAREDVTGRAPLYVTHGIMGGYGLICAEGELWKDQRRFLNTSLRQFGVQRFGPRRALMEQLILKEVNDCIKFIKERNAEAIEPLVALRHNLGSAVNQIVFGISYEREDPTWMWLQEVQEEGVKHIGVAGPLNFLPFLRHLPMFKNVMNFLLDGKHKSHEIYRKIIEDRLKVKIVDQLGGNVLEDFLLERERRKGTPDFDDFYNDQQFYHMLADVFGAGLDTTITTLCWYLVFMAADQDVQLRVREEIAAMVQGCVRLEDLGSLHLLEASIAEAQRIRSVVPMGIPHGTNRDTEINGYFIPKGTMVVPLQWAFHMDDNVWEEPEVFKPERFIDGEGHFRKSDGFMPFQAGKRMCIGDELARMLMLLFAGNLLLEFEIRAESELDLKGVSGITLSPKPQGLIFSPRKL